MTRRLAAVAACALPLAALPALPAAAADGPALTVDVAAGRHPISPDVYGMNWADPALESELGLTANRWGGNATTRYNWTNNTTNLAADWFFENLVRAPADSLDAYVSGSRGRGVRTLVTVPMAGWVAKDSPGSHPFHCGFKVSKYGAQQAVDQWDTDCGNGRRADGSFVTGNDPSDTSVAAGPAFVKAMVTHLVGTHGSAATTGVRTYALDNEPALWDDTHRDVHPLPETYDSLRDKSVATAKAIKEADGGAAVVGPSEWGWCGYFFSPADAGGCGKGADRTAHGDVPFSEWYLAEFEKASDAAGRRLLDGFDQHYYPQSSGVALAAAGSTATQALRLRSTRSLWDPTYSDESWIGGDVGAPPIRLIPWMREIVAARFPGTRTYVSEYNWGGLEHVNGALAQADVLGIFGRERLDGAMLWAPPAPGQPGAFAFRMYRNYDGSGGRFGETSVRAVSGDQAELAVYAAQRAADGAVTVMVVNKTAGDLTAPLTLSGTTPGSTAAAYRYSAADLGAIQQLAPLPVNAGTVGTTYPANSITLLVVPTAAPAAAALTTAATPTTVTYGTPVTVTGRLTSGGAAVAGRALTLQARRAGTSTWTNVGTATTATDGRVTKRYAPRWTAALRWRWAGDGAYTAATSTSVTVLVKAKVTTLLSPTSMPLGRTAKVYGAVYPAHPYGRYALQRWTSATGWRTVGTSTLTASSTFATYRTPGTRGTYVYRAYRYADSDHAAGVGPTVRLTVT
ncbi:MAG TPA: glycoside hydrolase family 44 protein [Frankiaceae bacterium]|nr:glycoside hydrolase family 44 protein [Frankiaceae bacterium]